MEEKRKVKITTKQCDALNNIRGLKQDAHYMVILAKQVDDGYVLEGSDKTFNDLVLDLYDEVEYRMQPESKLKHLRNLIYEISPEGDF